PVRPGAKAESFAITGPKGTRAMIGGIKETRTVGKGARQPARVDATALAAELRTHVRGAVRFDEGSRALYATDASNYRQVPIGVVIPRDGEDVAQAIATCRRYGAPVLPRGGGTSLAGQCCNV